MKQLLALSTSVLFFACSNPEKSNDSNDSNQKVESVEITKFSEESNLENTYQLFNSVDAINALVQIENEHFENFEKGKSRFYGTQWDPQKMNYPEYFEEFGADSMHCTIYAVEGLKAGMTKEEWRYLDSLHQKIYGNHEYAGWSIGYILVEYFNWRAFLVIDEVSTEYDHCMKAYKKNKSYPVWRQPNITLQDKLIVGKDSSRIDSLLSNHEFGWGFSNQGYHTWVTRFNVLKECNWSGCPSKEYSYSGEKPLFIKTPFLEYDDYQSHVVIFPPKKYQDLINYTDRNGLKQGRWENNGYERIQYYKDGKKDSLGSYGGSRDTAFASIQTYFNNGKGVYSGFPGMIYQFLRPPKESYCRGDSVYARFYYLNGNLLAEGMLVNTLINPEQGSGVHKIYYPDGNLRGEVDYNRNTIKYFSNSGKLVSTDSLKIRGKYRTIKKYPK